MQPVPAPVPCPPSLSSIPRPLSPILCPLSPGSALAVCPAVTNRPTQKCCHSRGLEAPSSPGAQLPAAGRTHDRHHTHSSGDRRAHGERGGLGLGGPGDEPLEGHAETCREASWGPAHVPTGRRLTSDLEDQPMCHSTHRALRSHRRLKPLSSEGVTVER